MCIFAPNTTYISHISNISYICKTYKLQKLYIYIYIHTIFKQFSLPLFFFFFLQYTKMHQNFIHTQKNSKSKE